MLPQCVPQAGILNVCSSAPGTVWGGCKFWEAGPIWWRQVTVEMPKGGSQVNLLIPRKHNSCPFYNMQRSDSQDPSLTRSPFLGYCDLNHRQATRTHLFQHAFSTIVDWNLLKLWAKRNFCGLLLFPSGTVVTEIQRTSTPHATTAHLQRKRKYCPTLVCHREENGTDREPGKGWRASGNKTWENSDCQLSLLQKHWNHPNKTPILSLSSSHILSFQTLTKHQAILT